MLKRTLVFTNPVSLSLRNCQLVVHRKEQPEEPPTTVPIEGYWDSGGGEPTRYAHHPAYQCLGRKRCTGSFLQRTKYAGIAVAAF